MTEQEANAMTDSLAIIAEMRQRDPFRDAMPCWHPGKVWPWTQQQHPLEALAGRMGNDNAFKR